MEMYDKFYCIIRFDLVDFDKIFRYIRSASVRKM